MPSRKPQLNVRARPEVLASLNHLCTDWPASQAEVVSAVLEVAEHRWEQEGRIPAVFVERVEEASRGGASRTR